MMHKIKAGPVRYANYELVVKLLREHGAMSSPQLARRLDWSRQRVASAIHDGRVNKLIVPHPANPRFGGRHAYSAAHVPGWPYPAEDTL